MQHRDAKTHVGVGGRRSEASASPPLDAPRRRARCEHCSSTAPARVGMRGACTRAEPSLAVPGVLTINAGEGEDEMLFNAHDGAEGPVPGGWRDPVP